MYTFILLSDSWFAIQKLNIAKINTSLLAAESKITQKLSQK